MGWLETDNRAISVQLNLTGTATGTELGNINILITGLEVGEIFPFPLSKKKFELLIKKEIFFLKKKLFDQRPVSRKNNSITCLDN